MLGISRLELAWHGAGYRSEDARDVYSEVREAVRARAHMHDAEGQCLDVLLVPKIAVQGQENLAHAGGFPQKFPILEARPAETVNGQDLVTM